MATRIPAAEAPTVPVVRPLIRPLSPEWTPLRALAAVERDPHTLFLESGGPIGQGARWTLLAFDPLWRLEVRGGALWNVSGEGGGTLTVPGDPLAALAHAWPERIAYEDEGPGLPFLSGLAGYLSYDLKDHLERDPARARRESSLPDLSLGFYDVVFAWDRERGDGWVVSTGLPEPDPRTRESRAEERLESRLRRLESGWIAAPSSLPRGRIESNFTRDEYLRAVDRALEHIAAGDVYQVNLAQRFRVEPS